MLRSVIEEAGIEFEVRNGATDAKIPTGPFYPRLVCNESVHGGFSGEICLLSSPGPDIDDK